jgi:hypothetical protein
MVFRAAEIKEEAKKQEVIKSYFTEIYSHLKHELEK